MGMGMNDTERSLEDSRVSPVKDMSNDWRQSDSIFWRKLGGDCAGRQRWGGLLELRFGGAFWARRGLCWLHILLLLGKMRGRSCR